MNSRIAVGMAFLLPLTAGVGRPQDEPAVLPTVVVTADRLPAGAEDEPFSITTIEREELRAAPQLRLDDILRNSAPGFSLFRRSSSRVANPTAQGVSLRNIGPNGAGRTLVLLDGIPLNDPFAGWVQWSRVPPSSIGEVIVNPGGGAGLFGNAALAGTIHLVSEETTGNAARLLGTVGNRDTYEASLDARIEVERFSLSTFVDRFETGGYPVLQSNQRGPVDTDADADSWVWQSRLDWKIDEHTRLALTGSAFEEHRNNGTRLTRNSSTGQDLSATLDRFIPTLDANVRLQAYAQRRKYRSTFSSVNAERTIETLALDQFDVPATAAGGSAVWSQQIGDAHRLIGGADVRWIEGETNEHFLRIDDAFTRYRNAGGRQLFVGAFLEENWRVSDAVKVVAGGRVDYWRQYDGLRVERDRTTGATLRAEEFAEQDGIAPNGRLGVTAQLAPHRAGARRSLHRIPRADLERTLSPVPRRQRHHRSQRRAGTRTALRSGTRRRLGAGRALQFFGDHLLQPAPQRRRQRHHRRRTGHVRAGRLRAGGRSPAATAQSRSRGSVRHRDEARLAVRA